MGFTNDKVTEYINSYYKPVDEDLASFRELNEQNEVPLILRETEGFLSLLLEMTKPSHILEIGTAYGYSAVFFAKKCPGARITTIDRSAKMIAAAESNFSDREEGDRIDFRIGNADEVLDEMIAGMESSGNEDLFDFVFIDAGKSHYKEFFDRAERLTKPGSLIVCDNILMHGWTVDRSYEGAKRHRTNVKYMRQFIEYIHEREDLTVSLLSSGDGLAVIRLHE
ncbi:MAG: O-methyltransferase [Mogibacterium sp.]|nr:O-methyltransferase [Mogibacterium sp.]